MRPIFHYTAERACAHVFLCLLAHYLERHLRQRLKPPLFGGGDAPGAEAVRPCRGALPIRRLAMAATLGT